MKPVGLTMLMSVEEQLERLSAYLADRSVYTFDGVPADYILDDEPLGFEKGSEEKLKLEVDDPLEEIDIGTDGERRPISVSKFLPKEFKVNLVNMIK